MLRRMWPVYARALHDTFVDAMSADEAAVIAEGLGRANRAAAMRPRRSA
jgi:hypothetical protein